MVMYHQEEEGGRERRRRREGETRDREEKVLSVEGALPGQGPPWKGPAEGAPPG